MLIDWVEQTLDQTRPGWRDENDWKAISSGDDDDHDGDDDDDDDDDDDSDHDGGGDDDDEDGNDNSHLQVLDTRDTPGMK